MAKSKIIKVNALDSLKMDFSILGIRSAMRDYQLAFLLNKTKGCSLVCRPDAVDVYRNDSTWFFSVYDGNHREGGELCLISLVSLTADDSSSFGETLFDTPAQMHLLPTLKTWDYLLIVENMEFAFDLEQQLKKVPSIATTQYFEAHTQLNTQETHLLYEIRNSQQY